MHGPDEQEEPEGPRMTRLRRLLEKSLQETVKACNYNAVQECFPQVAASTPQELRDAHEKVCQFLNVEVNVSAAFAPENEFEQIIQERNLIHKLNGLDRLIADAMSKGRTAGSSTILDLPPDAAVRARVVPTKEAEIQRLRAELERVRLDNRRLGSSLNQSKAQQTAIGLEIADTYDEFREACDIAAQVPIQDMEQLITRTLRHIHP
ncbi:hypothetical protein BGZ59_005107 [Podila verticillata]|nr:hypothetical protein BGZ59_005107 [Podila verticillata]